MKNFLTKNKKRGFTLVETLVAVLIFTTMVMVVSGALVSIIHANNQARDVQSALGSVSYALDLISTALGSAEQGSFECLTSSTGAFTFCNAYTAYNGIKFQTVTGGRTLEHYVKQENGAIYYSRGGAGSQVSYEQITPANLTVANSSIFYVFKTAIILEYLLQLTEK